MVDLENGNEILDYMLFKFNEPKESNTYKQHRLSLSPNTRQRIYVRDNYSCRICGVKYVIGDINLDIAHIIPVVSGGTDDDNNLLTLCYSCHLKFDSMSELIRDGIARKKKNVADGKDIWQGRGKDKKMRKRPTKKLQNG